MLLENTSRNKTRPAERFAHRRYRCGSQTPIHPAPEGAGFSAILIKNKKIPQEDACQLSELMTENKYRSSHERLGKIIAQYSSFPGDDLLRIYEITLFSFLTGNADMHLKNFSLTRNEKGHYRLTPAYDLVPTRLLLSVDEDPEELALNLNGKKSKFKRDDFLAYGEKLEIPEKVIHNVFKRVEASIPEIKMWINKSFLKRDLQVSYCKLIENRLSRLIH